MQWYYANKVLERIEMDKWREGVSWSGWGVWEGRCLMNLKGSSFGKSNQSSVCGLDRRTRGLIDMIPEEEKREVEDDAVKMLGTTCKHLVWGVGKKFQWTGI